MTDQSIRPRRRHRLASGIGLTVAMLLGLAAGLIALLQTSWAKDRLLTYTLLLLRPRLDAALTVGRLDGPLLGRVVLHDLRLTHRVGADTETVRIETVDVAYSLLRLITGSTVLTEVTLVKPEARLIRRGGSYPITTVWRAKTAAGGGMTVKRLIIDDGAIRIDDVDSDSVVVDLVHLATDSAVVQTTGRTDVRIAALSVRGVTPRLPIDALTAQITWAAPRLEITDAHITSEASYLAGRLTVDDLATWKGLDGAWSGVIRLEPWAPRARGRASLSVTLSHEREIPRMDGRLAHPGGAVQWVAVRRPDGSLEAEAHVRHANPARWLAAPPGAPRIPQGDIDAAARFHLGPFGPRGAGPEPWPFAAELRVGPSRLGGARIQGLTADARSTDGRLTASGTIRSDVARGAFGFTRDRDGRLGGHLGVELGDLAPLGALLGWSLTAPGSVTAALGGTATRPTIQAAARLQRVVVNTVRAGATELDGTVTWREDGPHGAVAFKAAEMAVGAARLGAATGEVTATGRRHHVAIDLTDGDVTAAIRAAVHDEGPRRTVTIRTMDLSSGGATLGLAEEATVRLLSDGVRIDALALTGTAGGLNVSGRLGARLDARWTLDALQLDRLLAPFAPHAGQRLTGMAVSGRGRVTGRSTAPVGQGHLVFSIADLPPLHLDVSSDGRLARARVRHHPPKGALDASVRVSLNARPVGNSSITGVIEVTRYPVETFAPFLERFLAEPAAMAGTFDGRLTITGTAGHPSVSGRLGLQGGRLELPSRRLLVKDLHLDVTVQRNAPSGRGRGVVEYAGSPPLAVELSGTGRVVEAVITQRQDAGGLSAHLHTTLDRRDLPGSLLRGDLRFDRYRLTSLQPFMAAFTRGRVVRLGGLVTGSVTLAGGTWRQPAGNGSLALEDGSVAVAAGRVIALDRIQAEVRLERRRVILVSLSGRRGGTLTAEGAYQDGTWRLALAADRLIVVDDATTHAVADGSLRVSGDHKGRRIEGAIRLEDVLVPLPSLSDPHAGATEPAFADEITVVDLSTREAAPVADGPATPTKTSALPGWEGALRIDVPRNAWARGPDGQLELTGAVDIRFTGEGSPIIEGEFRSLRGFYRLFGVKLDVESGVVRFSGIRELNPLLDITGVRTLDHYALRVHAGGTARKPIVSFSSDPPLEQTDIVSLLVTGKTTDQLTQGERSSLGRSVGSVVSSAAIGELRKSVGRQVPVDTIDLETGEHGASETRLTVGKYVSEDVFVKYGQSFGSSAGSEVSLEWSISDTLTLETDRRGDGTAGVDLLYTLRY